MSAKFSIAFLLLNISGQTWAFIPPAAYIFEQVAQKNPLKNILSAQFKAMLALNKKRDFLDLSLTSEGLFDGGQAIELYALTSLLNATNSNPLKTYLNKMGVDTNVISLGFFANEPVYIIGAQPEDTRSPQIWVEKRNWLVVKEIHGQQEIVFDKYQALAKQSTAKFPRIFTIKTGKEEKKYSIAEKPVTN